VKIQVEIFWVVTTRDDVERLERWY